MAIQFNSTNLKTEPVSFEGALLKGIAPDGGLFMPLEIPKFSAEEIRAFSAMKYSEIAFEVGKKFFEGEIPEPDLARIVREAYDFDVPLEPVFDNKFVMRLDRGPTASFKDFAARMMGRLMQFFLGRRGGRLVILTATSGDTGSAIANAFYGLDNIEVIVLFPEKEVTARQRKQMTTLGKNVSIIALDGKFDDCQALVKRAFADPELEDMKLSSANSINIGRLIPQSIYYFYAFAKLREGAPDDDIVFSVPSGNFGDLCGGLIAMKMGLPVRKFVVATNANDEFPKFLGSGEYHKLEPSRNCISSAMNVGHPSNVPRLVALYGGVMDEKGVIHKMPDMEAIRRDMFAVSIDDPATERAIAEAWETHRLLLEPHGAVGWAGLMRYLERGEVDDGQLCVSLETAHPAKFPEKIREILGFDPELPPSLEGLEQKPEMFDKMAHDYGEFKGWLRGRGGKDAAIRPTKDEREKYHVNYQKDTNFAASARLLQSKWREKKGYQELKLGNFLEIEFAKSSKANFLTDRIKQLVVQEVKRIKKEGGLIGEPRIWNNLLSSQPLCFNLFGELYYNLDLASEYFRLLFPGKLEEVKRIKFEYSPGRGNNKYTDDNSAFDVFIEYSSSNKRGFIGIEVKYAESLKEESNKKATNYFMQHEQRYTELTNNTGIFRQRSIEMLKRPPLSQIWRDHLLSIATKQDYDEGFFVFLFPRQNEECQKAVDEYRKNLISDDEEQTGFYPRYLEDFINILREIENDDWTKELQERYLGA